MTVHHEEPPAGALLESIRNRHAAEVASLSAENERLREQVTILEGAVDGSRAANRDMEAALERAMLSDGAGRAENERLRGDHSGMLEANVRLRDERDAARAEVEYRKATEADLRAEVEQLRKERDEAIAHDRQPYPTADAYEAVCHALRKHRSIAERALDVLARLAVYGLGDGRADEMFAEAVELKREFEAQIADRPETASLAAQLSSLRELESAARGLLLALESTRMFMPRQDGKTQIQDAYKAVLAALPPTPPATEGTDDTA